MLKLREYAKVDTSKYPYLISKGDVISLYLSWPKVEEMGRQTFDALMKFTSGLNVSNSEAGEFIWWFVGKADIRTDKEVVSVTTKDIEWEEIKSELWYEIYEILASEIEMMMKELNEYSRDVEVHQVIKHDSGWPAKVKSILPFPIFIDKKNVTTGTKVEDNIITITQRQPKFKEILNNSNIDDLIEYTLKLITDVKGEKYTFDVSDYFIPLHSLNFANFMTLLVGQGVLREAGDTFRQELKMGIRT